MISTALQAARTFVARQGADRVVAATMVQWLGSPAGQAFVASVLGIGEYQG